MGGHKPQGPTSWVVFRYSHKPNNSVASIIVFFLCSIPKRTAGTRWESCHGAKAVIGMESMASTLTSSGWPSGWGKLSISQATVTTNDNVNKLYKQTMMFDYTCSDMWWINDMKQIKHNRLFSSRRKISMVKKNKKSDCCGSVFILWLPGCWLMSSPHPHHTSSAISAMAAWLSADLWVSRCLFRWVLRV